MTVHLSPSVLRGLRLVTIGFGLASSGLLAGPGPRAAVRTGTVPNDFGRRAVRPDRCYPHPR